MSLMHLTPERIFQAEAFQIHFNAARMESLAALPGNPFGVEVRRFGSGAGTACKVQSPLLRGKNRIQGFGSEEADILEDLLDFYRRDEIRCSLSVKHGSMTEELFRRLTEAGMWSAGSGTVPAGLPGKTPEDNVLSGLSEITIRYSPLEEKEQYLDLFQKAFEHRAEGQNHSYRQFQWVEDALPGGLRYIAEIDGTAVGMASFPIIGKVAFFGTAGVLPEFRGRGVQTALIHRRIADAARLGCEMVLGGGSYATTTFRNFERAGLHLIPTGMAWSDTAL